MRVECEEPTFNVILFYFYIHSVSLGSSYSGTLTTAGAVAPYIKAPPVRAQVCLACFFGALNLDLKLCLSSRILGEEHSGRMSLRMHSGVTVDITGSGIISVLNPRSFSREPTDSAQRPASLASLLTLVLMLTWRP